jgi:hypothetical protein
MSAIVLTTLGKNIAETTADRGPRYTVLSQLYEVDGPVEFEDIMNELHTDEEKASMIVRGLIRDGLCKEV